MAPKGVAASAEDEGWDFLVGGEVARVEEDGEDVLLTFTDGSVVRARNGKHLKFVCECLADPE
jgi:hypothetical protein